MPHTQKHRSPSPKNGKGKKPNSHKHKIHKTKHASPHKAKSSAKKGTSPSKKLSPKKKPSPKPKKKTRRMKPQTDEDRIHESEAGVLHRMETLRARDAPERNSSGGEQSIPDRRDEAFAAMLKSQETRSHGGRSKS